MSIAINPSKGPTAVVVMGLVIITGVVVLLNLLAGSGFEDTSGAILVAIGLFAVSLPIFAREARRQNDRPLFAVLIAALIARFAGALARVYFAFEVYGGFADAAGYHAAGVRLAERFRHGIFDTGLASSPTNFIKELTGAVYALIGPSRVGGYFFFAWLAFMGSFFFYRAFTIAVPEGRRRLYAALIFFLPSLVFWPSSIGKESWLVFTLGLAALGAAHVLTGRLLRGFVWASSGLWLASFVRPHVAGMLALSVMAAALIARLSKQREQFSLLKRAVALAVLVSVALVLVQRTNEFLRTSTMVQSVDLHSTLTEVRRRTTDGGSTFSPAILDSPSRAPVAAVTVLFRPLIMDAHNAQALIGGVEGTFLLLLTLFRLPQIFGALRMSRRRPYVLMAFVFTGLFIVGFSSIANFGLLARERVQLLPLFFVLLTAAPAGPPTAAPAENGGVLSVPDESSRRGA